MPLEHAILAFLDFAPMTGYDLKKLLDQSVAHFWSTTQSHIYKSLEGLQKKNWAKAKVIPQEGKPSRKEYQITKEGKAELHRWLITPLPLNPVREDWLIQIFFSHFSSNEEIADLLKTRIEEMKKRLETLRTEAQESINSNAERIGVKRDHELWQITLDYGVDYYESQIAWLEKTVKRVKKLP